MNWLDVVLLLCVALVVRSQARREAGQTFFNAVATLASVQLTAHAAPAVTSVFSLRPFADTGVSPLAHFWCFGLVMAATFTLAACLHKQTRWSMDQFDWLVGGGLGLLVAVVSGHEVLTLVGQQAIMKHGALPSWFETSALAPELQSFRTYHYVVNVLQELQYGGR